MIPNTLVLYTWVCMGRAILWSQFHLVFTFNINQVCSLSANICIRKFKTVPIDQLSNSLFKITFSFKIWQNHSHNDMLFNISHRACIVYSPSSKRMMKRKHKQTCSGSIIESIFWTKVMVGKNNHCPENNKPTYEKCSWVPAYTEL